MKINRLLSVVITIIIYFSANNSFAKGTTVSDSQIKKEIIAASIASYPGVCACPFNQARNGSACGRRSAWSKPGGYEPICYNDEVTPEMIRQWREKNDI